jgi:C4-dicarboxylate transporter DctQ subunit
MLGVLRFLEDLINEGDAYEKLPKVVPYLVLPLSAFLLVLRFTQVAIAIWKGKVDRLIASHEVEEEIEQLRAAEARNAQGGQN